ncbi:LysR family transcriptional regulator [Rhodobacteraceae bacterium KMM 6894]|nr:LysR family transcriptional regulator [Rhodobacteraceae bacterium KMM 6894]
MLNANWLETFTTLCEVGHFTQAADRLGMTQPGVSQHLRKLEMQIGKALILKDGKSFTVTPAGEALLAMGKTRRAQERALHEQLQVDDPNVGSVSIGCSGSFALWAYPRLLERLHGAPDLVIRLTAAPRATIVASVLSGELDLGIVAEKPDGLRLDATPLMREELCLVLPSTFAGADLSLQQLNDLGMVAHPDGFAYADDLLMPNFPNDYKGADHLRIRTFVNQIGQIPIPVTRGLGYTILPKSGVEAFPDQQDLTVFQLQHRRYHDLWVICRQGRSGFARIAAIKDLIEAAAKALG